VSNVLLKCKQRGLWYVAKRFDNNSSVKVHVDKKASAETKTVTQTVPDIGPLHIKTRSKNPDGWEIQRTDKNGMYHLVRHVSIHLLDPSYVRDLQNDYQTTEMVEDWWEEQIEESATDLSKLEFMHLIPRLAIVTLEDPVVRRTTLYTDVFEILHAVCSANTHKTRKSRSVYTISH
jgi:hypothetical protein